MVPIEPLTSPAGSDGASPPRGGAASEPDAQAISGRRCEVSPHPSEPEDVTMICSPSLVQDAARPAPATFSPPVGPQTSASQAHMEAPVQYHVPQSLFAETQANVQSVSQPPGQVQPPVSQPPSSSCAPTCRSPSPLHVSVPVPQQQTAPAPLSNEGDDSAVQQHTQNSEFNRSFFLLKRGKKSVLRHSIVRAGPKHFGALSRFSFGVSQTRCFPKLLCVKT